MRQYLFGVATILMLAGGTARAEAGGCREEIHKLCPDLEPGEGRMRDCIQAHRAELSPQCQARVDQRQQRMQEVRSACSDDLKQKCSDIVPGRGRKLMCLAAHEPTLSPGCAAVVRKAHHLKHARRACREDARTFCPNIPPGEGRIKACLEAHHAQLSPACGAVIAPGR